VTTRNLPPYNRASQRTAAHSFPLMILITQIQTGTAHDLQLLVLDATKQPTITLYRVARLLVKTDDTTSMIHSKAT
jgi:hypothetical protein